MMANKTMSDGVQQHMMQFLQSPVARRVMRLLRGALTLLLLGFVIWRLGHIGWNNIAKAASFTPAMLLIFGLCYAIQPGADFLVYRRLWRLPVQALPAFFRKRALNEGVMDYSGEAWMLDWARRRNIGSLSTVGSALKDVNLLSILTSHFLTLIVVASLMATGLLDRVFAQNAQLISTVRVGSIFVLLMLAAMLVLQKRYMRLARRDVWFVSIIHVARVVCFYLCSMLLWSAAVPGVAFSDWPLFAGAQLLASRLPFVPNRDLMMAGVGVALAPALGVHAPAVASLFVITSTSYLALNLCTTLMTSRLDKV